MLNPGKRVAIVITALLLLLPRLQDQELTNTAGRMMEEENKLTIGG